LEFNYIAIEGNIGAGKSTLTKLLCEDLNATGLFEQFADNPYLPEFYKNPEKNAFPLEVSFLAERFRQMKELFEKPDIFKPCIISDFVFEKSLIFARFTLAEPEFLLFEKVFRLLQPATPKPDAVIYLHREIPSLRENINRRGRSYELNISNDYLQNVTEGYIRFLKETPETPLILVEADQFDFLNNPADRSKLLAFLQTKKNTYGLNFYPS
jgi:deoxyadenosine/deoxycytidine kinase